MKTREQIAFVNSLKHAGEGVEVRAQSPGDRGVDVFFIVEHGERVPKLGHKLTVTIEDGEGS